MKIERIMEFFYKRASDRIRIKVESSNKTHAEIYKTDPKLISRIINNKRTRVNPFLIPDAVIKSEIKKEDEEGTVKIGLVNQLNFKTAKEVLWGTDEEIRNYLPDLFKLLWDELPDKDSKYQIDKDLILLDYVPYAENSAYYDLCLSFNYDWPFMALYGRNEDVILCNQEKFKQKAFDFLYLKCARRFEEMFDNFSSKTDSFHKINKQVKENFIDTVFVNLIKENIPNEHSLGLRVKNIIKSDLSLSAELIIKYRETGQVDEMKRKLLNAASTYTVRLEEIQKDMIKILDTNNKTTATTEINL